MSKWLNHVTIRAARNGTTSYAVDPASTTGVVNGAAFTPSAGRMLVCITVSPGTMATPAGWTAPPSSSGVNNTAMYFWYKSAAGSGGDAFAVTADFADQVAVFDIYELPIGSEIAALSAQISVNDGAAPGGVAGLDGTAHLILHAVGIIYTQLADLPPVTWSNGVSQVFTFEPAASGASQGYVYATAYEEDSTLTAATSAATETNAVTTQERITVAFVVGTGVIINKLPTALAGVDQTVEPGSVVTLTGAGTDIDGTVASYSWAKTVGPTVTLSGTGNTRTFIAPSVAGGTSLTFALTVTDNSGGVSNPDTMTVAVLPATEFRAVGGVWVGYNGINL